MLNKNVVVGATALVAVLGMSQSFAVDTTAAVAAIDGAGVSITAVGTAILGCAAIAFTISWVKATFF